MRILAFGASTSRASINRQLAHHAARRLGDEYLDGLEIDALDLSTLDVPLFSVDREREDGPPPAVRAFLDRIAAADALIVSFSEHNGNHTAAYKSLFDWASRQEKDVYQGKPLLALSTSPGGRGGASSLKIALASLHRYGAQVVASLSVPRFGQNFDTDAGRLTDPDLAERLGAALSRLASRLAPEAGAPKPGAAMWDTRYADAHAAYGVEPNAFVRAVAGRIPDGPVLVIAAGEGRDAIYLAEQGFDVTAMDQSAVGMRNAATRATERGVSLTTVVGDLATFDFGQGKWAGIVSVWAHVPPAIRQRVHEASVTALKPGGVFILEAYHPEQLAMTGLGGPPVVDLLLDASTARRELEGLRLELCQDVYRDVAEGRFHRGASATVQVLASRDAST